MRFHPIHTVLYGLLVLAAVVRAQPTVAVAFTDVKFDDKAAIWSLLLNPKYEKVIAVTSGINDHWRAAQELSEYLDRQNSLPVGKHFDTRKLVILKGSNHQDQPAPHEVWWKDIPRMGIHEADAAHVQQALRGNRVAIFQIAPAPYELVKTVIGAADPSSIDTYMLLHGYNSGQVNKAWQRYFLQNLQGLVRDNNPQASVVFTSSFDSYADKGGGKQPYTAIQRMFPNHDLDQAIKDPFWSGQLRKAEKMGMPAIDVNDKELEEIIYNVRMNPQTNIAWRDYLAQYVQETLDRNADQEATSKTLGRYRNTLLPEFTGNNPVTLELADAGHIAALHRYWDGLRDRKATGMQLVPIKFLDGSDNPDDKIDMARSNRADNHGMLLVGADRDKDLRYIKQLAGMR
ncbi:conserved hypothetical protein [Sporisorium reilianum SRZ2]|uniref:Uncharacterized protein n=1 Tax=Sporisorium reilianum (strain SRZ2) TaxID=999809 RepID=E7A152_SPORE|nr:conserved hypothetical protein [Sporisorium reilianum SRZ2]